MKYAVYSLVVAMVVMTASLSVVSAANEKNPFEMVWAAIKDIQEQIVNIALLPGPQGEQGPVGATSTVPGPIGPQGPQGEPGEGGPSLVLKDANGQNLGILLGSTRGGSSERKYETYLPDIDVFLQIVERTSARTVIIDDNPPVIYFTELNCLGTPFDGTSSASKSVTPVLANGKTYKITGPSLNSPVAKSRLDQATCSNGEQQLGGILAEEITLPFNEPIAYPLSVVLE